jgi:curved DNA-binding protein CbpA
VLGVRQTASTAEIRTAFRRLALTLHPDRAGRESTEAFREVAAAYEVLADPLQRERYDARLASVRASSAASVSPPAQKSRISRVSGALRSLLAAGLLRTIGENAYEVWLTADEAATGGFIVVSTSPPNQLSHWITVPSGVADRTVLPSVLRVNGLESVVRLQVRTFN